MAITINKRSKSKSIPDHGANYLIRQLDQLQQLAADYRRTFLGDDFFTETRNFYNMALNQTSRAPTFRPRIEIPQLQMFCCTEASDLADSDPKIYIIQEPSSGKPKRDKTREKAFQAQWREGFFNLQIMYASLWSMLAGNGYLQVGFDRFSNFGRGRVWVSSRDPETVYADPAATDDENWYYLQYTDRMYPDQVRELFPERGGYIHAAPPSAIKDMAATTTMTPTMIMPPGPMSTVGGMPEEKIGIGDGRVQVRVTLIRDSTVREVIKDKGMDKDERDMKDTIPARFEKKYPNGRMIVDCEGILLFDVVNPYPRQQFNLVRICGLPPLNNFYAPPPIRVSRNLQETAQRMFIQAYENAVRLNNGVWFIDEATGITAEDFGGIPAEVRVVAANSRYPELKLPRPFPPQFIEYPKQLLQYQKELQGFTDARQGKQGAGNVGVDLYSEAVFHSQSLTRLRAKLMAQSVYKVAEQVFYLMAAYYHDIHFGDFTQDFELVPWERVESANEWKLFLDPGSIRPISAMALNKLALALKDKHMIDDRTALEWMNVPEAPEIADKLDAERSLEALSRIKGPKH